MNKNIIYLVINSDEQKKIEKLSFLHPELKTPQEVLLWLLQQYEEFSFDSLDHLEVSKNIFMEQGIPPAPAPTQVPWRMKDILDKLGSRKISEMKMPKRNY